MEDTGSLFPSLVAVGHAASLALVWYWRRRRDEPGGTGELGSARSPPRLARLGSARPLAPPTGPGKGEPRHTCGPEWVGGPRGI